MTSLSAVNIANDMPVLVERPRTAARSVYSSNAPGVQGQDANSSNLYIVTRQRKRRKHFQNLTGQHPQYEHQYQYYYEQKKAVIT